MTCNSIYVFLLALMNLSNMTKNKRDWFSSTTMNYVRQLSISDLILEYETN